MTNEQQSLVRALLAKTEAEYGVEIAKRRLAEADEEVARCKMEQARVEAERLGVQWAALLANAVDDRRH